MNGMKKGYPLDSDSKAGPNPAAVAWESSPALVRPLPGKFQSPSGPLRRGNGTWGPGNPRQDRRASCNWGINLNEGIPVA